MPEPIARDLAQNNTHFAKDFTDGGLSVVPEKHVAVVTCMDSRMDIFKILGLKNGEAHILRNAGGVVTDDVIRSLFLSQRLLGTQEIVLLHHTDCGIQQLDEEALVAELEAELGVKPLWALESFADPYVDVRQSIQRLLHTPFLVHKDQISGYVYEVTTGLVHEVSTA